MDFINTALVSLKQPTGFWTSILNAFKSAAGTYVLAVILLAVVIRIVFALVDIITKKVNMKNADINAKMRPELEAVQKKYGYDQQVLQKKQNEIYKKYQFSMMSSCLPMLVMLVLQSVVFLTLWTSLQNVANYNIVEKYENVKTVYADVINLNTNEEFKNFLKVNNYAEGENLNLEFLKEDDTEKLKIEIVRENGNASTTIIKEDIEWTNQDIFNLLQNYVIEENSAEGTGKISANSFKINTGYNEAIKNMAEVAAKESYIKNQERFLWIKNIYRSESPTSPLFDKKEITNYVSKFYSEEEKNLEKENSFEEKIFDEIIQNNTEFDGLRKQKNGYYILTIIAVLVSFLSMWLSNFLMRNKNQPAQKQSKVMYFVMPLIFGIFTFLYTSLFAIYIIVGQIVMIALTPLTTLIVKKWVKSEETKKKDKNVIEVDYRRKDN